MKRVFVLLTNVVRQTDQIFGAGAAFQPVVGAKARQTACRDDSLGKTPARKALMLRRSFSRPLSIAVGAGTALTAFGVAAPADATVDCTGGVTINATEAALRSAINNGESLICINPGTIDLSSAGTDGSANPIEITNSNLSLYALGAVTFDGGGETDAALLSTGTADEDLTVDGFTFTGFDGGDIEALGVVNLDSTTGTLTVLNSTFTDNTGYAMVSSTDYWSDGLADVVVDNTVFDGNDVWSAQVWGKADVTVTDSTFVHNNDSSAVASDGEWDLGANQTTISGSHFGSNVGDDPAVEISGDIAEIVNNTFESNTFEGSGRGAVINVEADQDATIAFNTFAYNVSDNGVDIQIDTNTEVGLTGNIWLTEDDGALAKTDETDTSAVFVDNGGNFSTADDSVFLDNANSSNNVSVSSLDLIAPADNGGPTWTVALGADSIAIDAVDPVVAANALEYDLSVDQRGENRVGFIDAGAFEYGSQLAATGVNATGIALTGGALGVAGVALAARRRRKA
jgi:hypothetical protein